MTTRRIVILGARGQVGRELAVVAVHRGLATRALERAECDIADPGAVEGVIAATDLVVNCAAYTNVDRAEVETEAAHRTNAVGAEMVAAACARVGAVLVHLSTDYVFDGSTARPLREDDPVRPLGVYGRSKLAGEVAIRARLPRHIILRTSWVFGAHGHNFVKTMLRLAGERRELRVVADQIGGPTAASDVAEAILAIADAAEHPDFCGWGTYHFSGTPAVSWYDFARAILADRPEVVVKAISTSDYPVPARRPAYTVLDCDRIARVFGIRQPDWRTALPSILEQLRNIQGTSGRQSEQTFTRR